MKDIALKIKSAIEDECQKDSALKDFCEKHGFTSKEFFDFLDFGAVGYSDFLEMVEDHERGVYEQTC